MQVTASQIVTVSSVAEEWRKSIASTAPDLSASCGTARNARSEYWKNYGESALESKRESEEMALSAANVQNMAHEKLLLSV